ncbi:MAG: methionyl-tRNA formyltransferase [Egibacteraceae bacterium]
MRLITFGYQTWGYRLLDALLASRHEVLLVVTHPDSDHAYEAIWRDSVADLAEQHGVPVLVRNYANDDEVVARLRELEPDILVAANWRTWIAPRVFEVPYHGALNLHDSLLPKYGGFAPLNWALINGEKEVGVTAHFMNEEFDSGDIVLQRSVPVGPKDTVTDLFEKTVELFGPLTLEALDLIESGCGAWTRQDPEQASFFHKRSIEDSRIDWTWPATDIVNLVRAQADPYPNAFTFYEGQRIRILAASVARGRYGGTKGRVFCPQGEGVAIVCGPEPHRGRNHALVIERLRTDDGREFCGRAYFSKMGGYLTAQP